MSSMPSTGAFQSRRHMEMKSGTEIEDSKSGARTGRPLSPQRVGSKYTEPERTSSSSFKPPKSKEAMAALKQQQQAKIPDTPESHSSSLFSFFKNVFSGGSGSSQPSQVSSSVGESNNKSLVVKVLEKKMDSAKKNNEQQSDKSDILAVDNKEEIKEKKDNQIPQKIEEVDSTIASLDETDNSEISSKPEKPVHKKPKIPFSYDPRKLKSTKQLGTLIENMEFIPPTILPSMPSDYPGDRQYAAKMRKIEQFKRRHMFQPTVLEAERQSATISQQSHKVEASNSGTKQEFIFPPREIKTRASIASQSPSRSRLNKVEVMNGGHKWNNDDANTINQARKRNPYSKQPYKQSMESPKKSAQNSSTVEVPVLPPDGRPLVHKSGNGVSSYRVTSSPTANEVKKSSTDTVSHGSQKSRVRVTSSPTANEVKKSQSSSTDTVSQGSQKSRVRSKSIPDRMFFSSRSEHSTSATKQPKRPKSVVPPKETYSNTSLVDDRDLPMVYPNAKNKRETKSNAFHSSQSAKKTNSSTSQSKKQQPKPKAYTFGQKQSKSISPTPTRQAPETNSEKSPKTHRHALSVYPQPPSRQSSSFNHSPLRQAPQPTTKSPTLARRALSPHDKSARSVSPSQPSSMNARKSASSQQAQSYKSSSHNSAPRQSSPWQSQKAKSIKQEKENKKKVSPFRQLISKEEHASPQAKEPSHDNRGSNWKTGANRSYGDYTFKGDSDADGKLKQKISNNANNKRPAKPQHNSSLTQKNQSSKVSTQSSKVSHSGNQSSMSSKNNFLASKKSRSTVTAQRPLREASPTPQDHSPNRTHGRRSPPLLQSSDIMKPTLLPDGDIPTPPQSSPRSRPLSTRSRPSSPSMSNSIGGSSRSPSFCDVMGPSSESSHHKEPSPKSRFEQAVLSVSPLTLEALSCDKGEMTGALSAYTLNQTVDTKAEYSSDFSRLQNSNEAELGKKLKPVVQSISWENDGAIPGLRYTEDGDSVSLAGDSKSPSSTSIGVDKSNSASSYLFSQDLILLDEGSNICQETLAFDDLQFDDYVSMNCSNSSIYRSPRRISSAMIQDDNTDLNTDQMNLREELYDDVRGSPTQLNYDTLKSQTSAREESAKAVVLQDGQRPITFVRVTSPITSAESSSPMISMHQYSPRRDLHKNHEHESLFNSSFHTRPPVLASGSQRWKDDPRFEKGREARRQEEQCCCTPARSRSQNLGATKSQHVPLAFKNMRDTTPQSVSPNANRRSSTSRGRTVKPIVKPLAKPTVREVTKSKSTMAESSLPLQYRSSPNNYSPKQSQINWGLNSTVATAGAAMGSAGARYAESHGNRKKSKRFEPPLEKEESSSANLESDASPRAVINKTISFFSTLFNGAENNSPLQEDLQHVDEERIAARPEYSSNNDKPSSFKESLKKDRTNSPWLVPATSMDDGRRITEDQVFKQSHGSMHAHLGPYDIEDDALITTSHVMKATMRGEIP